MEFQLSLYRFFCTVNGKLVPLARPFIISLAWFLRMGTLQSAPLALFHILCVHKSLDREDSLLIGDQMFQLPCKSSIYSLHYFTYLLVCLYLIYFTYLG